jgi:hypothetical protein
MKKEKIKSLPIVKSYADYFLARAKRILKLKNSEFESVHVDLVDLRSIDVWFFYKTNVVARIQFTPDGQIKDKEDMIDKRKAKSNPNTETITQGKPEDA